VFMLKLYKVITEAIPVTNETSRLLRHYTHTDTVIKIVGKTDASFQHNTHTSGDVNVSTHTYSDVRTQKLVRKLVATLLLIHWIADCGVSWFS
jgi:hypothetical protein